MILMIFVIPVFETMFKSRRPDRCPLPTLIVLAMSKFVKKYIYHHCSGPHPLVYLFRKYLSNRSREECRSTAFF